MTVMSKKGRQFSGENKRSPGFSGKNRGVTPSVAAPGVTHPSDATVDRQDVGPHENGRLFHNLGASP